jgi:lipid II:glycine glycyltransferase (peptidoglycan interpeptide bridge formation enzyme)
LTCSLGDLRKGLNQRWRNHLNRSEKNKLKLIKGSDSALYDKFSVIYNQMLSRKQFDTFVDINQFRKIQETLPDHLKMVIVLCEDKDEPVSTLICSAIGDTGIYLLGATNDQGMKTKGSYLLQWEIIKWLKERNGYRYYDLGGIDPERNPGVYHFKSGLGGKEVEYIGQFDTCESTLNSVLVGCGDELRLTWRKMRVDFNRMKNKIREAFKFRKEEGEKNG